MTVFLAGERGQGVPSTIYVPLLGERERFFSKRDGSSVAGLDPRRIDPLLTQRAGKELLIYRPFARGVTLAATAGL